MKRLTVISVFLLFVFISLSLFSVNDSTKQRITFLIDVNGGYGTFLNEQPLPKHVYTEFHSLSGSYSLKSPLCAGTNVSLNYYARPNKRGAQKFLGAGSGINMMKYTVIRSFFDHSDRYYMSSSYNTYSIHELMYKVNTLRVSAFVNGGVQYRNGFFLKNNLGMLFNTYVGKEEYINTVLRTSWVYVSVPPAPGDPSGGGWRPEKVERQETVSEKNYYKNSFSAFYSLNLGFKFKNIVYHLEPEIMVMNTRLNCILKYQAGVIFLL